MMNAKITNVSLTMENHGVLVFYLMLEGGGWGVSFGGYVIGKGYLGAEKFEGCAKGIEAIMRIMNVIGVDRWEDLEGKYCRIKEDGIRENVHTIGNILEDKWFDAKEFFKGDKS